MTRLALGAKWRGLTAPTLGPALARAAVGFIREASATDPRLSAEVPRNDRRDARVLKYSTFTQFLVIVSCRFKIARATFVQAASSAGLTFGGSGASPMEISFFASASLAE